MSTFARALVLLFLANSRAVFFARLYLAMTAGMGAISYVVLIRQIVCWCCHILLPGKISTSTTPRKFVSKKLGDHDLTLISPLKRLGHRFVKIINECRNSLPQLIGAFKVTPLDHFFCQHAKPNFNLIHP